MERFKELRDVKRMGKLRGWEGRKSRDVQLPSFPPSQIPFLCKWIGCGIALLALGFAALFLFGSIGQMPILNTEGGF